jgi:predicted TIM-barrel fold metal-dependent hydrolase
VTIVDVHCHTFNADDLPVRGFVKRVAGNRNALARVLARAIDRIIQSMADDAADELAALNAMLAREGGDESVPEDVTATVEAEAEVLLAEVTAEEPDAVFQAKAELAAEQGVEEGLEGITDIPGDLKRYLAWAALFGKRRLALTRALISTYPEVDLFTPMLVDLLGLEDSPRSTMLQQLEIQQKISTLSMRGDLGAAVHPFVGFDPRRVGALPLVQAAVNQFGCVGVKLYPLMGFRPLGNVDDPPKGMSAEEAMGVDDALNRLYEWCQAEHVPVTAHSNPSNEADDSFKEFSQPANWKKVLDKYNDLHLNLGHFGWGGMDQDWPAQICRLANDRPHLYADIGNHEVGDLRETFDHLAALFDPARTDTTIMRTRFMFGTDWFMVASHRHHEEFLTRFRREYEARFDAGAVAAFLGGTALSFLGFDDPSNKNNRRLRARYDQGGFPRPAWLKG